MAWQANACTFILCIVSISRFSSVIAQAGQNPNQQILQDVQLQQAQIPDTAKNPVDQVLAAQQVPPLGQQQQQQQQMDLGQQAAQQQAQPFQGQQQSQMNPPGDAQGRDNVQLEKHIIDFDICKEDIYKHCVKPGLDLKSDISIIECLQNVKLSETELLTAPCEHLIWEFKVNLTQDDRFRLAAKNFCQNEMASNPNLAQCAERKGPGLSLSCFIDYILTLPRESRCFAFLDRSARLAFSDFRVVGPFVEKCRNSIQKLQCGTLTPPSAHAKVRVPHTQGHTLECLISKIYQAQQKDPTATVVDEECRHEIMRIAELQSDDFHLDRQLFFACREDREKFCKEVPSGDGKVLECLLSHRTDALMNPQCSLLLSERATMMGENARMAHPLLNGCAQELREFQCLPSSKFTGSPNFHLSWVLLCLENAARIKPARVTEQCRHEMLSHRQMMMSEFRLSPEVVMSCGREIDLFCSPKGDIEKEGRTLHCLMQHATERDPKQQLGPQCMQAIQTVAKVADVGSNYKVDQVLYASCRKLIEGPCAMDAQSEANTLTCLMRHMDEDMPRECEDRLIEIQYFMARDWTLDPQLYQACHDEAVLKCSASPNWHMPANLQNQPDPGPMVLACLYRAAYNEEQPLSEACGANVRRVLRTRAVRVNLMPEIEASCRGALSEYCSSDVKPMQELRCLQEHFEENDFVTKYKDCSDAVGDFTKLMAKDTELNQALTKACRPVITTYCQQYANEEIDHGDVLECLLAHKDRPEMPSKCRSYVNHFELITLRDYKFSYRFKTACEPDIKKYCSDAGVDKGAIIRCLSTIVFEHKVLGTPDDLEKDCKKQLKTAYLQQEQVNFDQQSHMEDADPVLMKKCKNEVSRFKCRERKSFEDVIECLRENFDDLGPDCKAVIFAREKIEAADNRFDDELQSQCRADIDKFCHNEEGDRVLDCLQNTKILRLLSKSCQKVVLERMREQAKDVRLNVGLFSACKQEAEKYCPADFKKINDPQYAMKTLEGVLVSCLRTKYVDPGGSISFSDQCKNEISKVIMESEFDVQLDPLLYKGCKSTITTQCSESVLTRGGTFTSVMECLKFTYKQGMVASAECSRQIARRLQESLVDLHLDPLLNEACANDVQRLCRDVPPGQSRLIICLLDSLKANENLLTAKCKEKLVERNELWNKAHREQAMILPETLGDVVNIVAKHPQRFSLLSWFGAFILLLFFIGCCCGRASKRIRRELKNR